MSPVNKLILDSAKQLFWMEIRRDDVLAQLVAQKVSEHSVGRFSQANIDVEPWMPDKTRPGLCVVLSLVDPTKSTHLHQRSYIHVMTTVGSRETAHILTWNSRAGIGYAASEALVAVEASRQEKGRATQVMHDALRNFMRTCGGFALYYDTDHTFLDEPTDKYSDKATE